MKSRLSPTHLSRILVLFLLPWIMGGITACALLPRFPWQDAPAHPLAAQRRALRRAFWGELDTPFLQQAPHYTLRFTVDTEQRIITGTAAITVTNRTEFPWSDIALRLYPNLAHYGGGNSVELLSVASQDEPLPFALSESGTAALVNLPTLLLPQETTSLLIRYRVRYPRHERNGYWLFGEHAGIVNLPLAYPLLALPKPDGAWVLSDGIPLGDTLSADAAFYHVWATVPATTTLVSSAVVSATTPHTATQRVTYELVSGPAREFTLLLGPYTHLEQNADDIDVRVFYLPEDAEAGEATLRYALAVLGVYQRYFGPYPFIKLDVAEASLLNRGMEYSTLNLLGTSLFRGHRNALEFLTAHEIGHQWWYNLVGNDQVGEPWLDEGLTEYSTYVYYEYVYGRDVAESLRKTRWEIPFAYVQARGLDAPLGLPATSYSLDNYETVVYGKGALFFHTLRQRVGDEAFFQALREYRQRFTYRVATAQDLQRVFEAVSGMPLDDLFAEWVYGGY